MTNRIRIKDGGVDVTIEWRVLPDGESWVAICDSLKLTTHGETWDEMAESIADVQGHLFRDLLKTGELRAFLTQHGWTLEGTDSEDATLDVPWLPVMNRGAADGLHA
jgi:hypothetical protein